MQGNNWVLAASGGVIIACVGIVLAGIFRARQRRAARRSEPSTQPAKQLPPLRFQLILPNGKAIPLTHFPLSIGRSPTNDIVLDSSAVSAVHAHLYREPASGKVYIEDNNSLNGILLNGYPTRKNVLSDGVTITLGNVSLTYRVLDE